MLRAEVTDIPGIEIGHAQNLEAATGCTVVLCKAGAMAGVDVRGGSPGTRETDALDPVNLRTSVHAVLLAGGSAFGLDAAAGVMQYLEEKQIGRDVGVTKVPIVCGAILFDLCCGDFRVRPDKKMGYEACANACAGARTPTPQGNVGAGTGAVVGKIHGYDYAMKGGLGTACFREGELLVGAVMAVNCVGDVYDCESGKIIAGLLSEDKAQCEGTEEYMLADYQDKTDFFSGNTVIGVVVTNAKLTKAEAKKLASVSHNGIARTIRPAHSVFDGDTIFSMATGTVEANIDVVGILAVRAVEKAIISAIKSAETLAGFPSYREIQR